MYPRRPSGLNRKDKKQEDPDIKYIKNYTEEESENFRCGVIFLIKQTVKVCLNRTVTDDY
jgi:hypothetical protein